MSNKKVLKEFVTLKLDEIIPYENNPRINDDAVDDVIESIKQCENLDPIEIDEDNIILSGHTRLKALQRLGYTETECLRYTGLTDKKKRKYRLLANKVAEKAKWDFELLLVELEECDFEGYDFDFDMPIEEPFDESTLDDLFADAPEKEKKIKTAKCPKCGEVFEI